MPRVTTRIEDHIAHVTLTRADKMNAVDDEMIEAIIAAGQEVAASDARVVVLSGEGKGFCAGIDIGGLSGMVGKDPEALIMPRTHGDGTTNKWQEVALGADIRIAAPETKLAVMEMKWGIVPDMGGMVLLPRLVRSDVLRRLTYTGAPVEAAQAERWGLVTEVADDPQAAALELARVIAGKGPNAVRAAKRLIGYAESGASDVDVLEAESREQAALLGKPEQMEVIAAEFGKRPAVFK